MKAEEAGVPGEALAWSGRVGPFKPSCGASRPAAAEPRGTETWVYGTEDLDSWLSRRPYVRELQERIAERRRARSCEAADQARDEQQADMIEAAKVRRTKRAQRRQA